ncbi:hypothetical protein L2E82_19919 [Cichorium intybus]|uniref:Uncharacterized protein n=1 Tax=Cichorium intybus TaxID=13427 RepID=A0ACB9DRY2_CICIN|nr:hypothetical protein L2E82_19919 [Cichorium intybus]
MEWNWKMKNGMIDVTPFLLFESSADSEDSIADDDLGHHHRHHNHHQEKHEEKEEEILDDDVESCSYDHPFHPNVKTTHDTHHQVHEYDDGHDHGHRYDDNGEDMDDDDDNWGESKMMGQEKRCHGLCADSSNLDDRQFWETCLDS